MEKVVADTPEKHSPCENGFLKASLTSMENGSLNCNSPLQKELDVKDALSYANILRTRNKFAEALAIYEGLLEKDKENVEAYIGKGICLQMQNSGRLAFESFSEAIRLDPQMRVPLLIVVFCTRMMVDLLMLLSLIKRL